MTPRNGKFRTVETLLRLGADKSKRNKKGDRAADLVADHVKQWERDVWRYAHTDRDHDAEFRKALEPYQQTVDLLSGGESSRSP